MLTLTGKIKFLQRENTQIGNGAIENIIQLVAEGFTVTIEEILIKNCDEENTPAFAVKSVRDNTTCGVGTSTVLTQAIADMYQSTPEYP